MMVRPFSLYLLLALVLALAVAACVRSSQEAYSGRGEKLTVVANTVKEVNRVLYTEGGKNYVITSREQENTLALVKARVLNQRSAQITLNIDKDAARLSVENGGEIQEIRPLDFREMGVETAEVVPVEYLYRPFLWDQVQIPQGFEISGWMIFEVPKKSKYLGFAWDNVEVVTVLYPS